MISLLNKESWSHLSRITRPFFTFASDLRVRPNCVQMHQRGGATLTYTCHLELCDRVTLHNRGYDSGAGQAVIRVSREHSWS